MEEFFFESSFAFNIFRLNFVKLIKIQNCISLDYVFLFIKIMIITYEHCDRLKTRPPYLERPQRKPRLGPSGVKSLVPMEQVDRFVQNLREIYQPRQWVIVSEL